MTLLDDGRGEARAAFQSDVAALQKQEQETDRKQQDASHDDPRESLATGEAVGFSAECHSGSVGSGRALEPDDELSFSSHPFVPLPSHFGDHGGARGDQHDARFVTDFLSDDEPLSLFDHRLLRLGISRREWLHRSNRELSAGRHSGGRRHRGRHRGRGRCRHTPHRRATTEDRGTEEPGCGD